MELPASLVRAAFGARLNRFCASMEVNGGPVLVHVPNSGRLRELLRPENPMLVAPSIQGPGRRTAYRLALVQVGGVLVSADARLPNALVAEAVSEGRLPEFSGYAVARREVMLGHSRIDLLLAGKPSLCYVETKSVTLVENGVGRFPDAPTERGRKHVLSLLDAVRRKDRAAVVFVIQRPDALAFVPNWDADRAFCDTLAEAAAEGVEVYAFKCGVTLSSVSIMGSVPVLLK